jgi:hypothetical protein
MRAPTPRRVTGVLLFGVVLVLLPQGCSTNTTGSGASCAGVGGTVEECKQDWSSAQCDAYNSIGYNGSSWVHDSQSCTARGYTGLCGDGTYTKDVSKCQVTPKIDAGSPGGCTEGNYKCSGSTTIMHCVGGAWTVANACTCSVYMGDPRKPPYASTCKSGSVTGGVDCSYAGVRCLTCTPGGACSEI